MSLLQSGLLVRWLPAYFQSHVLFRRTPAGIWDKPANILSYRCLNIYYLHLYILRCLKVLYWTFILVTHTDVHLSVHFRFAVTASKVTVGTVEDVDILLESFQTNLNRQQKYLYAIYVSYLSIIYLFFKLPDTRV